MVQAVGTKAMVWHGTAKKTAGGLTKSMLMMNARGRIVSKKQHAMGKLAFRRNRLVPKSRAQLAALRKR